MLSDGRNGRSVIRIGINGRKTIVASWQTSRNVCGQLTINGSGINPLEERKRGRVQNRRIIKRAHLLNDEMGMTDEDALTVELLRRHVIRLLRIGKCARL